MFKKIVIQNVGVLRAFNAGASPKLSQLSLFYARNGRGKSTLTAVLRAAKNGSASTVLARRSLGNNSAAPKVTLISDDGNRLFEGGAWGHDRAPIEVFDAEFIADNVFAGEMTTLDHDRGLFSIIVGEEGVRLNSLLERFKEYVKKAKTALDGAEEALADDKPSDLSYEEFLELGENPAYQQRLEKAEKNLLAVRDASKIATLNGLEKVEIPTLPENLGAVIAATVPDIDTAARDKLAEHFKYFELGKDGEAWVDFGVDHMKDGDCPFCARPDADELGMVTLYGQIFGEEYKTHLGTISASLDALDKALSEEARTTISRTIADNLAASKEWAKYGKFSIMLPPCDTLAADLRKAHESAKRLLDKKRATPLELIEDTEELEYARNAIMRAETALTMYNEAVEAWNEETKIVQSKSTGSENDAMLAVKNAKCRIARSEDAGVQRRIQAYRVARRRYARAKKARRVAQTRLKDTNEAAAEHYHERVNYYLGRFGVSARITRPTSSMAGNAGAADYSLVIRGEKISRQRGRVVDAIPHFRNTLSSGDKTTLALAFFLAKLDHDGELDEKVVVFDDPLASHDSHRRGKTVEAIKELTGRCAQLILLSHDEYFLRAVEKRCAGVTAATYQMEYADGDEWTAAKHVKLIDLCKSDHAKRLDKLLAYVNNRVGDPDDIVLHIRQVLETHIRRSFTAYFPHNRNLGHIVRDIDNYSGEHPCAGIRDSLDALNSSTCDTHHGDDAEVVPRKGVDPDELKVIVTDALEVIGAARPQGEAASGAYEYDPSQLLPLDPAPDSP